MTDRRDPRPMPDGDRTDPTGDADDARWFREAVAPVVAAEPVPDAWDDIRARVSGESPAVVRLAPAAPRSGRPGTRRLALAAAAVVAVIGIGAAVVVTRDGGDDTQSVTATPREAATGWYIPGGLPGGWELESVSTDWLDVEGTMEACPCDQAVWISPDGRRSIGAMSADAQAFTLDDVLDGQSEVEPVVLDGGIDAHVGTAGPYQVVSWVEGDRSWQTATRTLDRGALLAAAGRVATDPTSPPVDGFRALTTSTPDLDGVRAYHSVTVLLHHPDRGLSVGYRLEPYGTDMLLTLLAGTIAELDPVAADQPLHQVTIQAFNAVPGSSGEVQREVWFLGQWPGAAISAGLADSTLATGPVTGDDIEVILRSLRPATGDEWQAFLDTATGSVEDDARTDRLSDLVVHEGDTEDDGARGTVDDVTEEPATDATSAAEPGTDTTTPDVATTDAMARAQELIELAPQIAAGTAAVPPDLFSTSVDLGLDFDQFFVEVSGADLANPDAWVIGEADGLEAYAGRVAPFSAVDLLAGVDAADLAVTPGGPEGCGAPPPAAPELDHGWVLVTVTPTAIDSCIDWFAVTLVVDPWDGIVGVHLYLREP